VVQNLEAIPHAASVERVYREQHARLWRALVAYTGDRYAADDALAETFAQVLARGGGIDRLDAWVWRTAFRVAAGEMQRRAKVARSQRIESYELPEPIDHVVRALSLISPNQRLAIVLHDYADRDTGEIARTLGVSRATVHVHLSQGRRRLRRLLEANDE
jgi:RNA polymerase sigma-70 factor, ECF subfamily